MNKFRATSGGWEKKQEVVVGTGELVRLKFRESSTSGADDATGPFLDMIELVETTALWNAVVLETDGVEIVNGTISPIADDASFCLEYKGWSGRRKGKYITFEQSPVWKNWKGTSLHPTVLRDAPIALSFGPNNHWMFGRYTPTWNNFEPESTSLPGHDVELLTTPYSNVFDAPGGLKPSLGGYHAWQTTDLKNWVHHGPVTNTRSRWATSAEQVDGKLYLYYDFPNDQDPHLFIDDNLFDGEPGVDMGIAFQDPSDGSDSGVIRDLDGIFHLIYEDWSPINAGAHSWDSPLAGHAVSSDGIGNFQIMDPAVDVRTTPTGQFADYSHPHWHRDDPANYPSKPGTNKAYATYEIHDPAQDAYGDWAAISVGGQYYLFGDYHKAGTANDINIGWFTSSSLDEQFTFCGEMGSGHPDPDIMFADGQFYLVTQIGDYVSPGPWVGGVEVRVGSYYGTVHGWDWTAWQEIEETYDYIEGFSKQIAKTPARIDISELHKGQKFAVLARMKSTGEVRPIISNVKIEYV
mmetsp:Transcript_14492/g.21295  ORF Transcript_14492/g.21295 Transcript_14492/m.21295 type:complete len:521 (-) Transcript_14492:163-1725(-)|eukprot:CAMPEP_0194030460 /NCGR_PEP_ID=MMETSP0009_2-20130614/3935_1 /TAXON_ID=210454 /ORGANISM="Grammatophora oceanica, Strain CCMP 410" /LENGTH=520 /DNA_ID=CAMNT_0038670407 /DNA_START=524 /DNA_END=2086 /DNA_ORIENTATION=-